MGGKILVTPIYRVQLFWIRLPWEQVDVLKLQAMCWNVDQQGVDMLPVRYLQL